MTEPAFVPYAFEAPPGSVLPGCPVTWIDAHGARPGPLTDGVLPCFTAFCFADIPLLPARVQALDLDLDLVRRGLPFRLVPLTRQPGAADAPAHG